MSFEKAVMPGMAGFPEDWQEHEQHSGPFGLLGPEALRELGAYSPEDMKELVGEERPPTEEEMHDAAFRAMDIEEMAREASHPQGISHPENVAAWSRETGREPKNWGYGISEPFSIANDPETGEPIMTNPPSDGPGITDKPRSPYDTVTPNIIGNMAWPSDFADIHMSEPMDLSWRLLKYRTRHEERQRRKGIKDPTPKNIFATSKKKPAAAKGQAQPPAPPAPEPPPELLWDDPSGTKGHFQDRLNLRFPEDEHEEIKQQIKAAWAKRGNKIWNNAAKRQLLASKGATLGIITHNFDSPREDPEQPHLGPIHNHGVTTLVGDYDDKTGLPVPAVATHMGVTDMDAIRRKFNYIIDATQPNMPVFTGDVRTSYYMEILDQLLKDNTYQTTLGSFMGHDSDPNTPIMAIRGMSPDRADRAMLEGLGPSPNYPVGGKPVVWSVGGQGPRTRRAAADYGPSLIGIKSGAMSGVPHEIGPDGLPIYASQAPIAPEDLVRLMLKHAKSPEAKKNKQKYDKDYHSSPSRVKYRVDLKRERRQRGIYGKGGKDMSHTKDGGLVAEASSTNRARQGSNGQSTKKAFDIAWDILKELSTEDLRFAARTGGLRATPERRFRNIHGQMEQAAANTAGGLQPNRMIRFEGLSEEDAPGPAEYSIGTGDVPLTVGQAEALDLASHQRIGQSGNYSDSPRPEGSMGDPSLIEPEPQIPLQELPSFSGDAPLGDIADVYQGGVPHIENRPPSPGPQVNPFPAVPRESRVAVTPRARPKSAAQIHAEIEARMAQEAAMAPDVPAPAPAPQPFVNPRKVGVRRAGAARGTPRRRSEMRRE